MDEEEAKARLRLIQIQKEKRAAADKEPEGEGLDLQDVRGFGQTLLRGSLAGWGDEFVGAARTLTDKLLPETEADRIAREITGGRGEQDIRDTYAMHRDDARRSQEEFARENKNIALATELVGALASPLNKIAPSVGATGGPLRRAAAATARGGAEGALAGLGEGEGALEDQLQRAYSGGQTGAGFAGALSGFGGALGRTVSKRRVAETLEKADGTFKPLHLASDGLLGDFYRGIVGRSYGGMEKLHRQQEPFLRQAKEAVETAGSQLDDQVRAVNNRTVRKAVDAAIPPTMPAQVADDLRSMDPSAAERKLSKWYRDHGFKSVVGQESFRWDPKLQSRIRTMLNDNPELKTQVGGAVGGIKRLDDYLNPMSKGGVPGDVLMEIRNTFARKANAPTLSLRGKGNRSIADEFDNMIAKRLGGKDSQAYQDYAGELAAWGNKQALSKAARQARKGGVDIDAKNIGSKAPDMSPVQQDARRAREQIVGLKQAAKQAKKDARTQLSEFNRMTTPEKATGLSSLLTTGLLGGWVAGPAGAAVAIPAGIGAANVLAKPSVQKAFAGQLDKQRMLAQMLRRGDTAGATRLISREIARQSEEEE
jgi:hypothetical protein